MADVPTHLPSPTDLPPHYDNVVAVLQIFFPQFFDPELPQYIEPDILTQLIWISEEARPWCLPDKQQDFAQAMYTAYLVTLREETSSGGSTMPYAGPITSEKEGDIQVNYAMSATEPKTFRNDLPLIHGMHGIECGVVARVERL